MLNFENLNLFADPENSQYWIANAFAKDETVVAGALQQTKTSQPRIEPENQSNPVTPTNTFDNSLIMPGLGDEPPTIEVNQEPSISAQASFISSTPPAVFDCNVQTVSTPNVKSGIYRKIRTDNDVASGNQNPPPINNVVISQEDNHGQILRLSDFKQLYAVENENLNGVTENPDQAIPMEQQSGTNGDFEKPTIDSFSVLKKDDPIDIAEETLNSSNQKNEMVESAVNLNDDTETVGSDGGKVISPASLGLKRSILRNQKSRIKKRKHLKLMMRKQHRRIIQKKKLEKLLTPVKPDSTTRSGRVSRPPFRLRNTTATAAAATAAVKKDEDDDAEMTMIKHQQLLNDLKDLEYKCTSVRTTDSENMLKTVMETAILTPPPPEKRIRKLPPGSQCPVCKKILLGIRMQKHFLEHPDHNIKGQSTPNPFEMSLYNFLVNKIKTSAENEDRTEILLNEISNLVYQLQLRSSKLVRSTSGMHFVNTNISKILGIPEGQYSLDVNAIDETPDPISQLDLIESMMLAPPPPSMDYNLTMSLDDTKLNLSDNMTTSDESLLRTVVDDLVETGIRKLNEEDAKIALHNSAINNTPLMHYDHISDNAVEAVSMNETTTKCPPILDLSLEMFEFNTD